MSLIGSLKQLYSGSRKQNIKVDLRTVFQTVYGREPSQSEIRTLHGLTANTSELDHAGAFRAIINGFDHQKLGTAFSVRFDQDDVTYISIPGFELAVDRKDISVSAPLINGDYEPHLFRFLSETLKPGMVFIDIGANVGFYSMLASNKVGRTGKVISFEPNTENCRLVMLSINKNSFDNVSLYPFAIGDKAGYAMFSSHLGSNGGLIPDTEESLTNPNCVIVPLTKLDSVVGDKVDVIKIDVEGAEGLVIGGAKGLIEKHRPIITSEFSLEMLPRVSGISGKEYLRYFVDQQYDVYLCDRDTQKLVSIRDVDTFVDDYGEVTRIEDLVFLPRT